MGAYRQVVKTMLLNIFWVGIGGFAGSVARYLVSGWAQNLNKELLFPLGTSIANILGCLFIGLLAGIFQLKGWANPELRLFVFVGILGGFTTFSTFANESFFLIEKGEILLALFNVVGQVTIGLLAVWGGYSISRLF